ncbi:hypothetical protein ARNL5_02836 [Anaerolineae bacterium]|nr:hypothetical protein [Anaerolinea sp.]MCC6975097.1 hypothetical protein [Anaerolineae bacterium]CAG0985858.1 hypothetical protein ARNL5_02836 [Anaerolineae bacterium]
MSDMPVCPQCGAVQQQGLSCEEAFHQMLYWEAENPANGAVHHLMVICYYLQHPRLYSPEGLAWGMKLLADFLTGMTPAEMRTRMRVDVDSGSRRYKIGGTPASYGVYSHPIQWSHTAVRVVEAGPVCYCQSVRAWAQAVYTDLRESGNLSN